MNSDLELENFDVWETAKYVAFMFSPGEFALEACKSQNS